VKCPKLDIEDLTARLEANEADASLRLDELISAYPDDPQLLFLKGSILAGEGQTGEGRRLIARSLELAPDYDIARFQLGFLELTSGDAVEAEQTWAPLREYPADHFLRLFVDGLGYLIRDDFAEAIRLLRCGIEANDLIPQMNHDMQLIIDQIGSPTEQKSELSESHLLLQRYNVGDTRH
jgi:tetratricopeptide (TPR) repeat protein